tara:strand:- start:1183 stop:1401 length:219 start_codon:yes stop_codon:yes gene_type:complete
MAVKMYKAQNSKWVKGFEARAHLDDGWTFEPSKPKATLKPRRRKTLKVEDVEIKTESLGPEDSINEETNNGN